jgi:uncharacterized membrane protein
MVTIQTILDRLKSKVVLASLAALILFILKNYGLLAPIGLTENSYTELTNLIFALIASFSFLNNPETPEKF